MSDGITLSSNAAVVLRRFGRLGRDVQQRVVQGVRRALLITETDVQRRADVKWRRGGAGLAGRLTSYAEPKGDWLLDAAIGFRKTRGFPYELSQEFGAKAKPGKAMSIPLTDRARRAGSPRDYPGELAFVKTANKAFLVPEDAGPKLEPAYILVKSIPARLNFRKTVEANVPTISREVEKALEKDARIRDSRGRFV